MTHRHENRFISYIKPMLRGQEVAQELSIPRKARRLDAVYAITHCHGIFGPAAPLLQGRAVVFEHESAALDPYAARSADFGRGWLSMRWELVHGSARRVADSDVGDQWLTPLPRAPIAVVLADGIESRVFERLPAMTELANGVWCSHDLDRGGLLLIDTRDPTHDDGWTFWRFIGACSDLEEVDRRAARLLGDPRLATLDLDDLLWRFDMNEIEVSAAEKKTLMVRLYHDRFEQGVREGELTGLQKGEALGLQKGEALGLQKGEALGLQKGEALGLEKGRRDSLLEMAAQLLPDQLDELAALADVDELAREVTARLKVHRG